MGMLFVKGKGFQLGYAAMASPATAELHWLEFGRLGIVAGEPFAGETGDREAALDILTGSCRLEIAGGSMWEGLGGRADPFSAGPTIICLPPGTSYRLTATSQAVDICMAQAPAEPGLPPRVIRPEDAPAKATGAGNWARRVWPGTCEVPGTRRLMFGETLTPPGNWASYPPHKHDCENPPNESIYEEVYFYLLRPAGGYAIQRVYERRQAPDALNEVYVVEDGDAVVLPRGYHPLVAAAGYQLCYPWAMCGSGHVYGAWSDDPAHSWIRAVEPILK